MRIAALAAVQHGVVARWQLLADGFAASAIDRRIASGHLHAVFRGVYAVGHRRLTAEGWCMAGVLAAGPGALLSHRSAAALRALIRWNGVVEVTAPCRRRPRRGLRIHESAIPDDERTVVDGIPVTTVARTLLDLAALIDRDRLAQAVAVAEARQLTDLISLPDLLERYPARRGTAALREILADRRLGRDITHSDLELEFVSFLRRRGLPRPELNVWLELGGRRVQVDCLWREARLVAELDSRKHHLDLEAFERDRARDRLLVAAGYRTMRITYRALQGDADPLESELRATLRATSSPSRR